MSDGIYSAASGALASMAKLDSVANNLANVNTPGYRKQDVLFSEVLASSEGGQASKSLSYARVDGSTVSTQQGGMDKTDRPLDVALNGPGFLSVMTPFGERFTRNGHLSLDQRGTLVGPSGAPLLDVDGQTIALDPARRYAIGAAGDITSNGDAVAKLRISEFEKPASLVPEGASLFAAAAAAGAREDNPQRTSLEPGMLEGANVGAVEQMTKMIELNRLYEATMTTMQTYREIDAQTNSEMTR